MAVNGRYLNASPLSSVGDRARRGASGALYPQSATAGPNPCPRSRVEAAGASRAVLMTRSHSVGDRELGQVRKEAALSDSVYAQWGSLVGASGWRYDLISVFDDRCTVTFF